MSGEANAYKWLRNNVFVPPARVDRVENLVVVGMPDVNGKLPRSAEFWLEIKAPTEPKRESTPLFGSNHRVSQEQANWFLRQRRAGGLAFFWLATDLRRILVPGSHADVLNLMTVREILDVAPWAMPVRQPFTLQLRESLQSCFLPSTS